MVANPLKQEVDETVGHEKEEAKGKSRQKERKRRKKLKYRRRKFPIILRVLLILALFAASLVLGLMFGYGILGQQEAKEILEKDVWQHIIDIVKKK